ncbi:hypothetical protein ACLK19_19475 [Escherichia coli]
MMVRNEQIASLERIRATRDDAAVTAALNALTHAAQHNEKLLAAAVMPLSVAPPGVKSSDALEVAFDRYLVPSQCVTGVIAQSYHQSEKSASRVRCHCCANGAVPCRQSSSPAHSDR